MDIKQQAELFFNAINAQLERITEIDKRQLLQEAESTRLAEKANKIDLQIQSLEQEKKQIEQEKEFIAKSLQKIQDNAQLEHRIEGKRLLLIQEQEEINKEKELLAEDKKSLEEKLKEADNLAEREAGIIEIEAMWRKRNEAQQIRYKDLEYKENALAKQTERIKNWTESNNIT